MINNIDYIHICIRNVRSSSDQRYDIGRVSFFLYFFFAVAPYSFAVSSLGCHNNFAT